MLLNNIIIFKNNVVLKIKNINSLIQVIIVENALIKKNKQNIKFFIVFTIILILNLSGLISFSFTITSTIITTFFISAILFIKIHTNGWFWNKLFLFENILPRGVTYVILPLLIPVETISYLTRVFSVSIRLFANMMSGHSLIKILIGWSWSLLTIVKKIGLWAVIVPWVIVTVLFFLETTIAFLQAYVYILLFTLYLNDTRNPH